MLFRRLGVHLKTQNWSAALIDLLIVITGIFLGIQVTDWNNERKERQLERSYLERIEGNLEHNIKELEQLVRFHTYIDENINKVASASMAQPYDKDALVKILENPAPWFAYPTFKKQQGTWQELVSSGRLTIIKDNELRVLLQEVASSYASGTGLMNYIRANSVGKESAFVVKFFNVVTDESGEAYMTTGDPEKFRDPETIKIFLWETSRQQRTISIRQSQLEISQRALERLQSYLKSMSR